MTSPVSGTRESSVSALRRKSRAALDDGFCNCECMLRVNQRSKLLNDHLERGFFKVGGAVAEWPYLCLIIVVAVCLGLTIGLVQIRIVTDVFELWTPRTSPYYDERQFYADMWDKRETNLMALACRHKDGYEDILDEKYIAEYFNFHMDLAIKAPKKIYTAKYFDNTTRNMTFSLFGENWKEPRALDDISADAEAGATLDGYPMEILPLCSPWVNSPLEAQFELSCYSLDIFHCFAEGGTMFPFENYLAKTYFTRLIPVNPYMNKSSFHGLSKVELGAILGPSCRMWADKLIPANYLYGGEERINESDPTSPLTSVRAYETLLYIDSAYGLARKTYMEGRKCKPTSAYSVRCPEPTEEEMDDLLDFVDEWLKDFIDFMLDYLDEYEQDENHLLKPLFFTSRTASDLLTEAFNSNLYLLAIAYILMLGFVSLTGCRPRNLFYSRGEASCAGMIIVLLSVLATMGLGAVFLPFSPNVIQVLPFIAVGLGVDDMFVMLQSFYFMKDKTPSYMVAEALRVAGPSVTLTSLANFLAFLIASFMPLPDVNRFARFGMIMVAIHYFVMICGFSSVLALLARRMLNGYNDFAWVGCWQPSTRTKNPIKSQKPATNEPSVLDPLFDFFTRDDIRIVLFVLFCVFFGVGLYGVGLIHVGLPLDSIVPASYGQDYLEARGKYFFSYINTLYTDGYRDEKRSIDWDAQFETWINQTEKILSVDEELVYQDKTIHSFWAWDYRDYYVEQWYNYLHPEGYTATFYTPATEISGKSSDCEKPRTKYCSSVTADYTYNSSMYQCLWFNKALLNPNCLAYLEEITPETPAPAIAKQVNIYNSLDARVAGLYTAPSSDTTSVYYRTGGGVLYQRPDLSWVVLDSDNTPKYFGLATLKGSQPPQYGWTDILYELVPMTLVYYDTTYYNYGIKRESIQETDDAARTSFKGAFNFITNIPNYGGCFALELMQVGMSSADTYEQIHLGDGSIDSRFQCSATLDATQSCVAIREGSMLGAVQCGSYEHHGGDNYWWIGSCNTSDDETVFTIAAGAESLDTTDACFCNLEATFGSQNNSYVQFCGKENFGGLNIDTSVSQAGQCGAVSQTLAVQCDALTTCDSLDVCYDFIATSSANGCGGFRITLYEAEGSAGVFGPCLLQQYSSLSTCCQQAVQKNIIDTNDCSQIAAWSGSDSTVCALKDSCGSDCLEICYGAFSSYGSINADCRAEIEAHCNSQWIARDQIGFESCMDPYAASNQSSPCCSTTFEEEQLSYSGCLVPRATYYDYTTSRYNFSDCSSQTVSVGCGIYDATNVTQLNCLLAAINSTSGCCQVALKSITNNYVFTKDCAGDVEEFCSDNTVGSLKESCREYLSSNQDDLSPNCRATLNNCRGDETWTTTLVGQTDTANCPIGYEGTQSRMCLTNSTSFLPYWGAVDDSNCEILYCPAEIVSSQAWRATPVGNVASWLGSDARVTRYSCTGLQYNYNHRYCGINATSNTPLWSDPDAYCRAAYLQWDAAHILNTTCDSTSSMIFIRPKLPTETPADVIDECQSICLLSSIHCDAVVYDKTAQVCIGYDWCSPINSTDTNYALYRTPNYFPEWMASVCGIGGIKPSEAFNERGIPTSSCFNVFLWEYLIDPQGGAISLDDFQVNDRTFLYVNNAYRSINITTTRNSLAVQKIEDDMIGTQFIVDLRDWVDENLNDKQLWVVLNGLLFDLDTQYINVTRYFVTNLLLLIIAVMVAGLLFLIHPLAACVVLLVEVVMVIEVYGFVDWADLHMNGILTLNMLVSIGLTMEFAAHIARAFMMASAKPGEKIGIPNALSGQIRMKKALRETFTPVTLTAITTFIGIAPIASASFPYFRDYYFVLYVMMILTGWMNGAIFQPVILSFLNPGTFSHENDRKSTARGLSKLDTDTSHQLPTQTSHDSP